MTISVTHEDFPDPNSPEFGIAMPKSELDLGRFAVLKEDGLRFQDRYRTDRFPLEASLELTGLIGEFKRGLTEYGATGESLVVLRMDIDSKYADVARYHEARIFKQEWYKDMPVEEYAEEIDHEFHPYEVASRFLLVMDTSELQADGTYKVAGVSRMIDGAEAPLKTVEDLATIWGYDTKETMEDLKKTECNWYEMDAGQRILSGDKYFTWDISSLAVDSEYRKNPANVYAIISQNMLTWAKEEGVHTWTTVLVNKFFDLYAKRLGTPFRVINGAEPKVHMGALSVPAVLHLNELPAMKQHPLRKHGPEGYELLVNGKGLKFSVLSV